MHDLANAIDVGVRFGVDEAGVAVAGVATDAFGFEGVDGVTFEAERNGEGMVAEFFYIIVNRLHARFAGERREGIRLGVEGFGGVGAGQVVIEIAVGGEEFFGTAVVGLEIGVGERPCRGDAVFVMEDAEVLGAEAEERGTVDLGLASDEVGLLRVERLIVLVEPDVLSVVTVIEKDGGSVPVKFLLGEEGAALEDEDTLAGLCEVEGEGAASCPGSDDDGVVLIGHEVLAEIRVLRSCIASKAENSTGFDRVFVDTRKEEGKDSAVAYGVLRAAEGEAATMAIDDAGGDPEAEARAVEILGGVEGFEEAGLHDGGHTGAGVGDCDANSPPPIRVSGGMVEGIVGADEETATTLSHRIDRVGDEVVEHLADVVFKAENGGTCGVTSLDVNAGVGETAVVEVEHGIDEIGCTYPRGTHGLTVETQGLGGNLADAREFSLGNLNVASYAFG
jgi:hypothetical protein